MDMYSSQMPNTGIFETRSFAPNLDGIALWFPILYSFATFAH